MAGGSLFRATALLHIPENMGAGDLRAALESLADDLMVEFSLDVASDVEGR
jgi:glycine cleavage system regulatory protein